MHCTFGLPRNIVCGIEITPTNYDLGQGGNELFLSQVPWVLGSHRSLKGSNVAGRYVSICLFHAWLPHRQRCGTRVAEGAQVQVARVTRPEYRNNPPIMDEST